VTTVLLFRILILKMILFKEIEVIVSRISMQSNKYPSQHMFRLPDHEDAVLHPFLPGAGYTAELGLGYRVSLFHTSSVAFKLMQVTTRQAEPDSSPDYP
jgi:hypothetical protein